MACSSSPRTKSSSTRTTSSSARPISPAASSTSTRPSSASAGIPAPRRSASPARRAPNRLALPEIEALYAQLRTIEADRRDRAIVASSMARMLELVGGHDGFQRLMFALDARKEAA
jgi:hypothetical protein